MKTSTHRNTLALVALLVLGSALPGSSHASTYNAVNDFSVSSNPNGVWSYGTLSSFTAGQFSVFTLALPTGVYPGNATFPAGSTEAWDNGGTAPNQDGIYHNKTSSTLTAPNSTVFIPPDVLDLAGQSQVTTLRWTAPATGLYNIAGFFERIDTNGNPVSVRVVENGAITLFSADNFATSGSELAFSNTGLLLPGGTTLDFAEGASQPANLSTGIAVTISTVPEPSTWAAMLAGASGLALMLRRRAAAR